MVSFCASWLFISSDSLCSCVPSKKKKKGEPGFPPLEIPPPFLVPNILTADKSAYVPLLL